VLLKDAQNPSHTAMARMSPAKGKLVPLVRPAKEGVWGIRARNMEQSYTLDLLSTTRSSCHHRRQGRHREDAAGHRLGAAQDDEEGNYQKLLVSRPIFPLGRDIGYLPGDVEQKLNPWMQPIFDNVEFLMNLSRADKKAGRGYHELLDLGILEIEPLTYIRGGASPISSSSWTRRRT
jgi:PhoH-like ATPase